MANKVLQQDRRFTSKNTDGVRGDAESLAGRIAVSDMGSRMAREEVPKSLKASKKAVAFDSSAQKKTKKSQRGGASILDSETYSYYPSTVETEEAFDLIMSWVQTSLEDSPHDIIRSAADTILTIVRDGSLRDLEKKKEVEGIVGELTAERYNQLVNLSKQLVDYDDKEADADKRMDIDSGVAVTFEDEDEDEDKDEDEGEYGYEESEVSGEESSEEIEASLIEEEVIGVDSATAEKEKPSDEIPAHDIDAYWLQRLLSKVFTDPHTLQEKSGKIFELLASSLSLGQVENDIMEIFDYEHFDITRILCNNRAKIVWLTRLSQAYNDSTRNQIETDIKDSGLEWILKELSGESRDVEADGEAIDLDQEDEEATLNAASNKEPRIVDLEALTFDEGSRLNSGDELSLPQGTVKFSTATYEEYDIPAPPKPPTTERLVKISEMPTWSHPAFAKTESLNRVQSSVYPIAFGTDDNILLCAPTGAGKTNVAMLTILKQMSLFRNPSDNTIDLNSFKVVYIAPLKALVQEQVRGFSEKLEPYGMKVAELTGDRNLTKQQLSETQMIVTTPEKWDVITRKSSDTSYTNLVKLIIIDEIHLLHDERGPVIESIVARSIRRSELVDEPIRLVGLSATLPNYKDVARFLRVPSQGIFYFDLSYRPCQLAQKFLGITEKKAFKRYQAMNDACYDKVMEYAGVNQVIIFVHSRKETAKTARFLRDRAKQEGKLDRFLKISKELLDNETIQNADLKDLLPNGFAIHHAGLSRSDRASAEDLFAGGQVQVLVSTATLAWGVNLPAHAVIIKGTQVYNPEKGRWSELSPQDVLQMLGRAGRPAFDLSGDGIIITAHSELNYYMSLINSQLPIESQFISKMADNLNAEVVAGSIRTIGEAVDWLGYTYLYVRMLKSPRLYRVGADYGDDRALVQKRLDLAHSALTILDKNNLVKYNVDSGRIQPAELGRIASHFYITHSSMTTYSQLLRPFMIPIDIFRIFSLSEEFKYIPVRQEEKLELTKLLEKSPIPVKENVEEPAAKINILLQAYISRLKLDGFALMADMVYITQSAGRLLRAIYEICLRKGWAGMTRTMLDLCKMVEKRMWLSNSPLRQFPSCPAEVIRKTEASQMPWSRYFDLADAAEVGQAIRVERSGKQVYDMLQQFPRLELNAHFQPVTPSLLRVELEITPKFEWNYQIHGNAETFVVLVEDCDGETILFSDTFLLKQAHSTEEHILEFTVPISADPIPPNYFVSLISEKWLHSESRIAISFKNLILPQKFPAHTPVYDLEPVSVTDLGDEKKYVGLYDFAYFNKIQTQVFNSLYNTDDSILIGASTGNGKTLCAEITLFRKWKQDDLLMQDDEQPIPAGKVVYTAPFQDQVNERYQDWSERLAARFGKSINKLTGELSNDLKILEKSDLILSTPSQWDVVSRRWQRRKNVQNVELFIADDVHMIGGLNGAVYEIIVSRMRYMAAQTENPLRIVGLSVSLSNGKDFGEWIGASNQSIFNFSPKERMKPMEVHLQSLSIPHHPSLMIAMARPTFYAINQLIDNDEPALVFLSDRKQCIETGLDLLRLAHAEGNENMFRLINEDDLSRYLERVEDSILKESLSHGIGYLYMSMNPTDERIVKFLFEKNYIKVLLSTRDTCWTAPMARLAVVMGTQLYEGVEHRYIDYPINELLQMIGKSGRPLHDKDGKALILTNTAKRDYYRKFLNEALPIESHLNMFLHDAFITEISEQVIQSQQDSIDWLTFSFFYRRLVANPSFYGLLDKSDEGLSEYLSDLVEKTLKDLAEVNLISLEEEHENEEEQTTISPLNGSIIAAYYNVSFITMQTLILSLSAKTKLRGLLEIVASATEFESIPIRNHEDEMLMKIYDRLPLKLAEPEVGSHRFKAFVLLQAHISRLSLPPDFSADQKLVLEKVLQLLAACVDVLSGDGHLNAMTAMDLSQMVVQAMWDRDSPLKQIPYFTFQVIKNCEAEK